MFLFLQRLKLLTALYPKAAMPTNHRVYRQYFIASVPFVVNQIWPCIFFLGKSISILHSIATPVSTDEQLVVESLDQIIFAVENDPISSKRICSTYIEKLCRTGDLSDAARLLLYLRDKQIFLNPNTYNLLVEAASKGNDFELLSQIFKDLLLSSDGLGTVTYFNIAKAFSKANDSVVLKFVREISDMTFPRSAMLVNRIISGFAKCREIDKSLLIFNHMKHLKCKPDIVTHNTVLGILGRAGRMDEMLHHFVFMKESGVLPDIVSYNTLINSSRKLGRLDLCLVFLREMGERGLNPDLRTYTALIDCFGRSGNVEESLRLFGEMKRGQITPSVYIYRSLISNLKRAGKLELARTLLEELNLRVSDLVGPKDFKNR